MIQNITKNWNIFRILRLILGLFLTREYREHQQQNV